MAAAPQPARATRMQVDPERIIELFHLPRERAAAELGISGKTLMKLCDAAWGLKRWPSRQVQSLDSLKQAQHGSAYWLRRHLDSNPMG